MQELTFETILRLPQMELKKRLKAELKSRGYPVTDKPGYLYAEGTIPVLLVAHMDTVHRQPVEQVCYSADGAVAMSPQGIGGDDRCGVWIILQILRTANCHVLFGRRSRLRRCKEIHKRLFATAGKLHRRA